MSDMELSKEEVWSQWEKDTGKTYDHWEREFIEKTTVFKIHELSMNIKALKNELKKDMQECWKTFFNREGND